jgi:hypothetical protein
MFASVVHRVRGFRPHSQCGPCPRTCSARARANGERGEAAMDSASTYIERNAGREVLVASLHVPSPPVMHFQGFVATALRDLVRTCFTSGTPVCADTASCSDRHSMKCGCGSKRPWPNEMYCQEELTKTTKAELWSRTRGLAGGEWSVPAPAASSQYPLDRSALGGC